MPDVLFEALCATLDHFDAGFVAVFPDGKICTPIGWRMK